MPYWRSMSWAVLSRTVSIRRCFVVCQYELNLSSHTHESIFIFMMIIKMGHAEEEKMLLVTE